MKIYLFTPVLLAFALSTIVDAKDTGKYYFEVIEGVAQEYPEIEDLETSQKIVLSEELMLNEHFDFRSVSIRTTRADGLFTKGKDRSFHFKGNVSVGSTGTNFDTDIYLGKDYPWKSASFSGAVHVFFIRFSDKKPIQNVNENE